MERPLPKYLCFAFALIQGVVLTFLYRSVDSGAWPATDPIWLFSLATFFFVFPWMVFLSISDSNVKRVLLACSGFALITAGAGAYIGWQQEPVEQLSNYSVGFIFVFTTTIASLKALMYVQLWSEHRDVTYGALFTASWRNVLMLFGCGLFTAILFGILFLGGELFAVLGIDFLQALLKESWFNIPLSAFAYCFATVILRKIIRTIDAIESVMTTLVKFLLPVSALVSITFVIAMPFSGLEKLWDTGDGTALLLWLQLLSLLFVNVVYVNQSTQPYPTWVHRMVYVAMAILPIYTLIAGYGLWLRIDQYGLTVDRCWALLVWFLLGCFSVGYASAIIRERDEWLTLRNKVNVALGLLVMVLMITVNTPLLNFQAMTVTSQFAKLDRTALTYDSLDFDYIANRLGRQGYLALKELEASVEKDNPDLALKISRLYPVYSYSRRHDENTPDVPLIGDIDIWPDGTKLPDGLISAIETYNRNDIYWMRNTNSYYLIQVDLNKDNIADYVYLEENNDFTTALVWYETSEGWQYKSASINESSEGDLIGTLLKTYPLETVEPTLQHLKIGDVLITVQ